MARRRRHGFLDLLPGYSGFTVLGRRARRRCSPARSAAARRWSYRLTRRARPARARRARRRRRRRRRARAGNRALAALPRARARRRRARAADAARTATRRTCSRRACAVGAVLAARADRTGWAVGAARRSPSSRSSGRCSRSCPPRSPRPGAGCAHRRRSAPAGRPLLLVLAQTCSAGGAPGDDHHHRPAVPPAPALLAVRRPGDARVHRRRPRHDAWAPAGCAAHAPADRRRRRGPRRAVVVRGGPERNRDDVLGVLALAFLLRCMLDPWNLVYYHLPLVVALAAWEARRGRDLPVLSIVVNAAVLAHVRHLRRAHGLRPLRRATSAWTRPARGRSRRRAAASAGAPAHAAPRERRGSGSRLTAPATLRGACPAAPTSAAPPSSPSTSTS